jgi:flagellar biosynthesis anti-sigma factor FlgM
VKIISANLTNTLASVDSKAAGNQRIELLPLEATLDDSVQLSSSTASADVATSADVDMDKVAAVRQAIAGGAYQVSADSIFDGLASSVREIVE